MTCTRPIRLRDSKQLVPCGKCYNCLANNRAQWTYRLNCENLASRFSLFVTLTYDNENLPFRSQYVNIDTGEETIIIDTYSNHKNYKLDLLKLVSSVNSVSVRDVQLFLKRLRKELGNKTFRYFVTSEYGDKTQRPHYHVLFFFQKDFERKFLYDTIEKTWSLGNVNFGETETASIAYCTKYCLKDSPTPFGACKTFRLMSRRPALGDFGYKQYLQNVDNLGYFRAVTHGVGSSSAPRLWRDKYISTLSESQQTDIKYFLQTYAENRKYERYKEWCKYHKGTFEDYENFLFHKAEYHAELAAKRRTKTKL